jgi:predicted permease
VACASTGIVTGLAPALQTSGPETAPILRCGGQGIVGNRRRQRLRRALVATEVALSLVLLVGAGLLVRSFSRLLAVDPGFEMEDRLVMTLNTPRGSSPAEAAELMGEFMARTSSLPSVESVAGISLHPHSHLNTHMGIVAAEDQRPGREVPWVNWRMVTPGYFRTLEIPVMQGRAFDADDLPASDDIPIPVIVSRRLSRLLWSGQNPLGRALTLWAGQANRPGQVVGVVGDVREMGLASEPSLAVYVPYAGVTPPDFIIHTAGDATSVAPALRSLVREMDPGIPFTGVLTLKEVAGLSVNSQRLFTVLVGLFASLALLLALAGVYGVQSYVVAQQTSEIGVRVAMGAQEGQILARFILQAMGPAMVGVAVGLLAAWDLSDVMAGVLFQVAPTDPVTYLNVTLVILASALLAVWVPARRALKVDPVVTFRGE